MTISEFVAKYKGQPVEVEDSSNRDQCMDLALAWTDNLGISRAAIRRLYAYQVFTAPNDVTRQYFDLISRDKNVPSPGDLVVWGTGVGTAGHIAIFVSGDASNFTSFDQNWDTANYHTPNGDPYSRLVNHNYNYVIGWLHPKGGNMPASQQVADALTIQLFYNDGLHRQPLDTELKSWDGKTVEVVGRGVLGSGEHNQIVEDAILGKRARLENWEKQIADLKAQLANSDAKVLPPGIYRVQ
jgi:CHAP domain